MAQGEGQLSLLPEKDARIITPPAPTSANEVQYYSPDAQPPA